MRTRQAPASSRVVAPRNRYDTHAPYAVTAKSGKPIGAGKVGLVRTGAPAGSRGALGGGDPAPQPAEFQMFSNFKLNGDQGINVDIPGITDIDGLGDVYVLEHTLGGVVYPLIETPAWVPATHSGQYLDLVAGPGRNGGVLVIPGALPDEIGSGDAFVERTPDGVAYRGAVRRRRRAAGHGASRRPAWRHGGHAHVVAPAAQGRATGPYSNAVSNGQSVATGGTEGRVVDPAMDKPANGDNTMSFTLSFTKTYSGWADFGPGTLVEFDITGSTMYGDNAACLLHFKLEDTK